MQNRYMHFAMAGERRKRLRAVGVKMTGRPHWRTRFSSSFCPHNHPARLRESHPGSFVAERGFDFPGLSPTLETLHQPEEQGRAALVSVEEGPRWLGPCRVKGGHVWPDKALPGGGGAARHEDQASPPALGPPASLSSASHSACSLATAGRGHGGPEDFFSLGPGRDLP